MSARCPGLCGCRFLSQAVKTTQHKHDTQCPLQAMQAVANGKGTLHNTIAAFLAFYEPHLRPRTGAQAPTIHAVKESQMQAVLVSGTIFVMAPVQAR